MIDYDLIEREESPQALRLARWVMRRLQPRSVIDLGCATGLYLAPFQSYNVSELVGLEMNNKAYSKAIRAHDRITFMKKDLSKPLGLAVKYDLGLCIEVAEHMPPEAEGALCENLAKACRTLIFSAAVEGQGGEGHINCRPQGYWISSLARSGLYRDQAETESLQDYMHAGYRLGWIRNAFVATGVY